MKDLQVQYVMDEYGGKTAALVAIEDWNKIFKVYQQHIELEQSICRGLADIAELKAGKQEAKTLSSFLDEL